MTTRITILGAGPGGYIAAIRAAQLGAEVTVIENDNLGGTCLNWGCIPTKTIKSSADAMQTALRLSEYGITAEGGFRVDMPAVMARKNKVVDILVKGIAALLKGHKIRLVKGHGTLISPTRVAVETRDDGRIEVAGDKLILATGSRVKGLPGLPLDKQTIISSDEALGLDTVPENILIVGGGVVGAEFAFILNGLGSKVTVVEALDRILPLPEVDGGISKLLQREMKKKKIKCHFNRTVTATRTLPDGSLQATLGPSPFLADIKEKDRIPVDLKADKILVCVGRAYNTMDMGLKKLGMEIDERGWIPVNHRMETSIPGVYAIGDVLGPEKVMLAHVASAEGLTAAENCLGANQVMDYRVVPSGIFTSPEIGSVGLTQGQAEARGLNYRADAFDFRGLGKSQAMGETAGQVKMVSDADSGRVLGVHIIGPHATDLVAEAALAIKLKASVRDIAETIHLHPSLSEGLMETAHAALDAGLHVLPKK